MGLLVQVIWRLRTRPKAERGKYGTSGLRKAGIDFVAYFRTSLFPEIARGNSLDIRPPMPVCRSCIILPRASVNKSRIIDIYALKESCFSDTVVRA